MNVLSKYVRSKYAGTMWFAMTAALALLGSVGAAKAETHSYVMDQEHFGVGFLVDHVGYAKVLGMFLDAEGSLNFDEATGELSDVSMTIKTGSVATNHSKRDKHLKGGDFLNAKEFPEMTFVAGKATAKLGEPFDLTGELTLLGVSQPVTLKATWNKSGNYPFGKKHYAMGVSARGSFKRSAHGMKYGVDNAWIGDDVELLIEFEAIRQ